VPNEATVTRAAAAKIAIFLILLLPPVTDQEVVSLICVGLHFSYLAADVCWLDHVRTM
jgi:hypothetical protein